MNTTNIGTDQFYQPIKLEKVYMKMVTSTLIVVALIWNAVYSV